MMSDQSEDHTLIPTDPPTEQESRTKRTATVYDVVAGRVGLAGFLSESQIRSEHTNPSAPEEVLLRRVGAPDEIPFDFYNADERLGQGQMLPDSDLLKDLHSYVSDFYTANADDGGVVDFRSMDETALLAMGVLLEEACRDMLGENGDMVLVEPEGIEKEKTLSKAQQHQIVGKVIPEGIQEYHGPSPPSDELENSQQTDPMPRKRRRKLREADFIDNDG